LFFYIINSNHSAMLPIVITESCNSLESTR